MDLPNLDLRGIIAFDGLTKNGLLIHPDQEYFIHPMGNKVTIKHIRNGKQSFLSGHTNVISTIAISPCGNLLASGQINHMGFKALIIIWDYEQQKLKSKYEIHKVRVEAITFSCNGKFLISLGGRDDDHIVIWDIEKNEALCGALASTDIAGNAYAICRTNLHGNYFLSAGDRTLKFWKICLESRKVIDADVRVGKLRRVINCIVIDVKDEYGYCGTTSGDIIKLRLNIGYEDESSDDIPKPVMVGCYSKVSKLAKNRKNGIGDLYPGGVTSLLLLENDKLYVGSGSGCVEHIKILDSALKTDKKIRPPSTPQIQTLLEENVKGAVSSMRLWKKEYMIVGTTNSEIYQLKLTDFDVRLLVTCHTDTIYDIAFPYNYSEIFATASKNDIRVWRLETRRELLRISVPNFVCTSLVFAHSGRILVSAWNDGIIRVFTPQTGRLIFAILNAHLKAVSAVAITGDGKKIISGGCDGQVRIWEVRPDFQKLLCILKEHRGSVTSLHVNAASTQVLSSSTDGTCIIWDINRGVRKQIFMGNTMFMSARLNPNGLQILTCGTDRKVAYWETLDGTIIREVEGSEVGSLNCLDISSDGEYFITGGNDSVLKLWSYELGETAHVGIGHAAIITACKISPNGKYIVTVSADGSIMIWKYPYDVKTLGKEKPTAEQNNNKANVDSKINFKNNSLDLGSENIKRLSSKSDDNESVKAVYGGSKEVTTCNCDPTQPIPSNDRCKESESRTPMIETTRSVKSTKSSSSKESSSCACKSSKNGDDINHQNVERKSLL